RAIVGIGDAAVGAVDGDAPVRWGAGDGHGGWVEPAPGGRVVGEHVDRDAAASGHLGHAVRGHGRLRPRRVLVLAALDAQRVPVAARPHRLAPADEAVERALADAGLAVDGNHLVPELGVAALALRRRALEDVLVAPGAVEGSR